MGCTKSQESVLQSSSNQNKTITPKTQIINNKSQVTKYSHQDMTKPIQKIFDFLTTIKLSSLQKYFHDLKSYSKLPQLSLTPYQNTFENNELNLPKIHEISLPPLTLQISLISKPIIRPLSLKELKRPMKKSKTLPPSKLSSYIFKPKPLISVPSQLYTIIQLNVKNPKPSDFYEILNDYNIKQAPRYLIDPPVDLDNTDNLTLTHILTFFNEMLESKFVHDEQALINKERPKEIFPYLLEYLEQVNNGVKLHQVITALYQYTENSYIQVIKRLLGIGQKDLSLNFSVFVCKVLSEFKKFVEEKSKMEKDLQKNSKKGKKVEKKNPSKVVDEYATLFSIFEYTRKQFTSTLVYSEIIKRLCPRTLSFEEYLIFYSIYKSRKIGCKISSLPPKDFLSSILNFINFPITPEQQLALTNFIKNKDKQDLKHLLSFTTHKECILKPNYCVKKSDFLLVLIESFEFFKEHTVFALEKMVKFDSLDREKFYDSANECENGFCDEVVNKLFDEGANFDNDAVVRKETFVNLMIRAGVGYLKYFRK